jgi:fatty-acyl-CoA synthase
MAIANDEGFSRVAQGVSNILADLAPPGATPTCDAQPRRMADFATVGDALDYAAEGRRGMNFHDARGTLVQSYPYAELRRDALAHASAGAKPMSSNCA